MQPTTQRKIADTVYRVCKDLGRVFGRDTLSYAETIEIARSFYETGKLSWLIPQSVVKGMLPANVPSIDREPDLSRIDTQEKFEALLSSAPEPSPEALELILKLFNGALPYLRNLLLSVASDLPHDRGGAPKKLSSIEDQKVVVEEIKALRGPGMKLGDIFKRVAQRHGVSASKIKQVWYSWAKRPSANGSV